MVQERQQEIVNELLNYMDTLEDGSEVSTWDLMDEVFNYQRFNDGYCFNDFKISEEEFISLDSLLKESAMKEGFFIDDSIYQDVIGAFPFSLTFVVRSPRLTGPSRTDARLPEHTGRHSAKADRRRLRHSRA